MARKKNPKLNKPLFEACCRVIGKEPEEVAAEVGLYHAGSRGGSLYKKNSDESRNNYSFRRAYENGTVSDKNIVKLAEYFASYGIKPKDRPLWVEDFILEWEKEEFEEEIAKAVAEAEKTAKENSRLKKAWNVAISSVWAGYDDCGPIMQDIIITQAKEAIRALAEERSDLWRLFDPGA